MKRFIIFLILPIVLHSCSSMYIPAVRSIPLLEKKGDFQGEAGVSTNSVYMNGSYAFTNDIAASINGNLSFRNFTNYYDVFTHKEEPAPHGGGFFSPVDTRGKFEHRYGEVSVGKINMLSPSKSLKLEIFGGVGMGRATDADSYLYQSDYYSFFGQGNFGFKKPVIEAGVSMRLAYSVFNYTVNQYDNNNVLFQNTFNAFHLEPMLFARMGRGNVNFVFRLGLNLALNNVVMDEFKNYRGFDAPVGMNGWEHTFFHVSIGVSFRFPNE